ncbi:unnamed protein product [Adineta ricciae]|uniref:HTH CENPB-type domain-containing protein n=1 Tax=Adineta ricciae TaxID=249248 RepID=A0A815TWN2_ADIRI|nr:unnamed protein product [Adineta ricciae]CAF1509636.1 unnamed protein product [Adineta ricciae]
MDTFCFSLPAPTDFTDSSSSSEEDDSDLEVTSIRDEQENDLVHIDDLCLDSDYTSDEDITVLNYPTETNNPVVQSNNSDENLNSIISIENSSMSPSTDQDNSGSSKKRKRRAWSIKEKLLVIEDYEKSKSKHTIAKVHGCTRFQLSEWIKQKEGLLKLQSSRLGGQRKRLKGAGSKLKYFDLDDRLIKWFKERRTPPDLNGASNEIRRERISFKQLVRCGTQLSLELKHEIPSLKWYRRFMKRHNLSLQRPKRNQKIPL